MNNSFEQEQEQEEDYLSTLLSGAIITDNTTTALLLPVVVEENKSYNGLSLRLTSYLSVLPEALLPVVHPCRPLCQRYPSSTRHQDLPLPTIPCYAAGFYPSLPDSTSSDSARAFLGSPSFDDDHDDDDHQSQYSPRADEEEIPPCNPPSVVGLSNSSGAGRPSHALRSPPILKCVRDACIPPTSANSCQFFTFHTPAHLWLLARAIYVVTRYLCIHCASSHVAVGRARTQTADRRAQTSERSRGVKRAQTAEDRTAESPERTGVTSLHWEQFDISRVRAALSDSGSSTSGSTTTRDSSSCRLSVQKAIWILILFVNGLQRIDLQRQRGRVECREDAGSFSATALSLIAGFSFQERMQSIEKSRSRPSCCGHPGLSLGLVKQPLEDPRPSLPSESSSSCSSTGRGVILSVCSKILRTNSSLLPIKTQDDITSPLLQRHLYVHVRDCVTVISIIQNFCALLFVGSAWVDEQCPLSTATLSSFVSFARQTLQAYRPCYNVRQDQPAQDQPSPKNNKSKAAQLKRLAMATASSLYFTVTPACLQAYGVLGAVAGGASSTDFPPVCSVCRDGSLRPNGQAPASDARQDFERNLFHLLSSVDHDTRVRPEPLSIIGGYVMDCLEPFVVSGEEYGYVAEPGAMKVLLSATGSGTSLATTALPPNSYSSAPSELSVQQALAGDEWSNACGSSPSGCLLHGQCL